VTQHRGGRRGRNVLAFQALNVTATDRDFLLTPELWARETGAGPNGYSQRPTPGALNGQPVAGFVQEPLVGVPRGFFDTPFDLAVTCPTPGATLVYTTNHSTPSLTNGVQAAPADAEALPRASLRIVTTTAVRVGAFKTGFQSSPVVTHTCLFLDDVLRQPKGPAGFPTTWGEFDPDYELDQRVVPHAASQGESKEGLRSFPTLSLVLQPDDPFGPQRGIYTLPEQIGDAWECPASLELIRPDGTTGFQVNGGVRIWGTGWRSHSATRKHALQVKFKDQYGVSRLHNAQFPDTPVTSFDNVVLRAQGSRGWNDLRTPDIKQAQYIHEAWARANAEFRLRYADRARRPLFNQGLLTPQAAAARWRARAEEVRSAILGESARWGDARRLALPYTRDVERSA
jgi:hypothetical protein